MALGVTHTEATATVGLIRRGLNDLRPRGQRSLVRCLGIIDGDMDRAADLAAATGVAVLLAGVPQHDRPCPEAHLRVADIPLSAPIAQRLLKAKGALEKHKRRLDIFIEQVRRDLLYVAHPREARDRRLVALPRRLWISVSSASSRLVQKER